jgi:hypothetical protein
LYYDLLALKDLLFRWLRFAILSGAKQSSFRKSRSQGRLTSFQTSAIVLKCLNYQQVGTQSRWAPEVRHSRGFEQKLSGAIYTEQASDAGVIITHGQSI